MIATLLALALPLAPAPAPAPQGGAMQTPAHQVVCVPSLKDPNTGACIHASQVPTFGMLYPLSEDFFVDPFGNVGIGTTAPGPGFKLDVNGASARPAASSSPTGARSRRR